MKYSKQRNLIREKIMGRHDHPTAQTIYDEIKTEDNSISLATVYRNINQLAENGEIRRVAYQGNTEHYDPILDEHFHFVCERCGDPDSIWHVRRRTTHRQYGSLSGYGRRSVHRLWS